MNVTADPQTHTDPSEAPAISFGPFKAEISTWDGLTLATITTPEPIPLRELESLVDFTCDYSALRFAYGDDAVEVSDENLQRGVYAVVVRDASSVEVGGV